MEQIQTQIEILNMLIKINRERITTYERAAFEIRELAPDTKDIFHRMASDSKRFVALLREEILKRAGQPILGASFRSGFLNFLADLRSNFTGYHLRVIFANCIRTEKRSQKYYAEALHQAIRFSLDLQTLIAAQQRALHHSKELIEMLRKRHSAKKQPPGLGAFLPFFIL